MASHKTVKGNICDDNGTWVIRARIFDPDTGKTKQRSKSTSFKVKNCTKRKAEQIMNEVLTAWVIEANTPVQQISTDPAFSEYIKSWLNQKEFVLRANSVKSYRDYADRRRQRRAGGLSPLYRAQYHI